MPTLTVNYSLQKPLVNDPTDEDLWGGELNDDLDDIDDLLRDGITVATESVQTVLFDADADISTKKLYPCDVSGGAFTVTIPEAATAENGATVFIKKVDSSTNVVTLARSGSDTLDGLTELEIGKENDIYGLVSDGVDKWNSIVKPPTNVATTTDPVVGTFANLKVQVNTATQTVITANGIVLGDGTKVYRAVSVNLTNTISTSGVNGLDTGSEAADTWYSVWVIYNETTDTVASLLSLSATSPTLPAGYTFKARAGWVRNNSSSNLYRTLQYGNRTQYVVGTDPVNKLNLISGVQGNPTAPTWVASSVTGIVPSTATVINGALFNFVAARLVRIAPNNSYDSNGFIDADTSSSNMNVMFSMILESTNIYYTSNSANAGIAIYGWQDNL